MVCVLRGMGDLTRVHSCPSVVTAGIDCRSLSIWAMARRCAVSGPYTSIYGTVGGTNKEVQPLFLCAGRKKMSSCRTPQNNLQQAKPTACMLLSRLSASLKVAPELAARHCAPRLEFVRKRHNWLSSTLVACSILRREQVHIEYM